MFQAIKKFAFDLSILFYPELCEACDELLIPGERVLCTGCMINLPKTGYHLMADNPVARQFYGRIQVHSSAAFWNFHKGGKVQRLLHRLKYEHKPEIGVRAGELYGQYLVNAESFNSVQLIIPVPLHSGKQKIRGYNQAACFAEGLAAGMQRDYSNYVLKKVKSTETQTRKSRFARFLNTGSAYAVAQTGLITDKHVLLVDDVITTGSTIEACAIKLFEAGTKKLSVASIAYAERV